jgi:hypothetical protein
VAQVKEHFNTIARLGCVVCGQAAEIHHCIGGSMRERGVSRGMSQKVSDWLVIPLCQPHHRGREGLHTYGADAWEHIFGKQADFLDAIADKLDLPLWRLAEQKPEKKYKRPSKVLPR